MWAKDLINNIVSLQTKYRLLQATTKYRLLQATIKGCTKASIKWFRVTLEAAREQETVCKNFFLKNPCVLKFNQSKPIFLVALPSHEICRFSEGKVFVKSLYVNHSKYTKIWYLKVNCKKALYLWSSPWT